MMWLAVVAYFVLACGVAALLLLPAVRERMLASATRAALRIVGARQAAQHAAQRGTRRGWARAGATARTSGQWLRAHWALAAGMTALLAVPPLAVLLLRAGQTLDSFNDRVISPSDSVVATLLQGEHLVPPPPLPPEVFSTAEVSLLRPQLGSADRRWEALDADFRQRLLLAYRLMRAEYGYEMVLLEGYRSPQRQNLLASLGSHVTNAAAWQSYHQHGLAADSAFLRSGRLVISERDAWAAKGYELYGKVADRVGLTWGGHWQIVDLGHVELRKTPAISP